MKYLISLIKSGICECGHAKWEHMFTRGHCTHGKCHCTSFRDRGHV